MLRPDEVAWLAAVPCAVAVAAVVLVVGPGLGHLLFPPLELHFWASEPDLRPEPTEQARYLLALLTPAILSLTVVRFSRRDLMLKQEAIQPLVRASQALVLIVLAVCIVVQQRIWFGAMYYGAVPPRHVVYFTIPTIVAAVALAVLATFALSDARLRSRLIAWTRDTRARIVAGTVLAALFTAMWLLTALNSDTTILNAHYATSGFVLWTLEETFSVLNGRTPLVNYHALYGSLVPYAAGGTMRLLGMNLTVWTTFMATLSCLALVGIYDVLRRVARSSVAALALYAPFVATGFFMFLGPPDNRYAPSNAFSMFPIRFAGAYGMAWLIARHLDGARPRRVWPLFLAGGLVALNNFDFGAPSVAATAAALLWSGRLGSWQTARRVGIEAATGLVGAFALVSVLTLARAGELPHLGFLFGYAKIFSRGGYAMLPMPALGFHDVLFLTYVAAIVVATVRAVGRHEDTVLTGMLAWAGLFGLGVASRYVGESHPEGLITEFSPWALALTLLVVAVVRDLTTRRSRRPSLAGFAVLVAFGLATCSLAQMPTPWSQIERLRATTPSYDPNEAYARQFWGDPSRAQQFVAAHTHPGEHVLILLPLGFRVAENLGLVDVSPFSNLESIQTTEQFGDAIAALRAAHGTKVFLLPFFPDHLTELERLGYAAHSHDSQTGFVEWTKLPST